MLLNSVFSKSDELTNATRIFLEQLKAHLQRQNQNSFTPQQIRKIFRLQPRTLQRYTRELAQYGLIKPVSGYQHRKGYEYAVTDASEYHRLTSAIEAHLASILGQLRQQGKSTAHCDTTATVAPLSQ